MRRYDLAAVVLLALASAHCDKSEKPAASAEPDEPPGPRTTTSAKATGTNDVPVARDGSPISSLGPVGKKLEDGVAAWLGGKSPATAFPEWDASVEEPEEIRAALQAAGVASAINLSTELEVVYESAGKDIYYLRTGVVLSTSPSFLTFEGRPVDGKVGVKSQPVDAYTGPAAPFREAVEGVLAATKKGSCMQLPFLDAAKGKQIAGSTQLADELTKILERRGESLQETCDKIASLTYDRVRIRVDDHSFLARNVDGKPVGTLKAGFQIAPGRVRFEISTFRAMK
jgi:hypothetical protein